MLSHDAPDYSRHQPSGTDPECDTSSNPSAADYRPSGPTKVFLSTRECSLPGILRHLEAGRIVVILAPNETPALQKGSVA